MAMVRNLEHTMPHVFSALRSNVGNPGQTTIRQTIADGLSRAANVPQVSGEVPEPPVVPPAVFHTTSAPALSQSSSSNTVVLAPGVQCTHPAPGDLRNQGSPSSAPVRGARFCDTIMQGPHTASKRSVDGTPRPRQAHTPPRIPSSVSQSSPLRAASAFTPPSSTTIPVQPVSRPQSGPISSIEVPSLVHSVTTVTSAPAITTPVPQATFPVPKVHIPPPLQTAARVLWEGEILTASQKIELLHTHLLADMAALVPGPIEAIRDAIASLNVWGIAATSLLELVRRVAPSVAHGLYTDKTTVWGTKNAGVVFVANLRKPRPFDMEVETWTYIRQLYTYLFCTYPNAVGDLEVCESFGEGTVVTPIPLVCSSSSLEQTNHASVQTNSAVPANSTSSGIPVEAPVSAKKQKEGPSQNPAPTGKSANSPVAIDQEAITTPPSTPSAPVSEEASTTIVVQPSASPKTRRYHCNH